MPFIKALVLTIFFFQFSILYGELEIFNWDDQTQYEVGNFVSNVSVDSEDTWRVDSRPPIGTPVTNSAYFTALSSEGTNLSTLYPNIGSTKPEDLSDAEKNSIPTADIPPDTNPIASASVLQGIAARGLVSSSQPMFGGIAISGSEDLTVAFMGKGQSMGVSPYAADPILEIWSTSGKLSENDNWGTITDSVSSSLSTASGITPPTGTTESGMVMTLAPGNYSFVLKSKSGSLSGAMIEAYEVD